MEGLCRILSQPAQLQWDRAFDGAEIVVGGDAWVAGCEMLQWDRAFDGAEICAGDEINAAGAVLLQWDRAFDGAEMLRFKRRPSRAFVSFNGTAPLMARKWPRSKTNTVTRSEASMGPRL